MGISNMCPPVLKVIVFSFISEYWWNKQCLSCWLLSYKHLSASSNELFTTSRRWAFRTKWIVFLSSQLVYTLHACGAYVILDRVIATNTLLRVGQAHSQDFAGEGVRFWVIASKGGAGCHPRKIKKNIHAIWCIILHL